MKLHRLTGLAAAALIAVTAFEGIAQDENTGVVRRRTGERPGRPGAETPAVTERMQNFFGSDNSSLSDGDRQWLRIIYRSIDLDKDENAALYFPEEPVDGQENLFRIIMRLFAAGQLPAYEYLDGREIFTDQYKVRTRDVLDRFHIPYTEGRGSTERNPRFDIDENDVPTNEVLSYYVIERWEFDNRHNRLRPVVEAICPVMHRTGDFGGEPLRYPMFWIKFNDLRPFLATQTIFVDDDNNLPTCTYDDFFTLTMYDGDIYKTRNLKNRSMAQLYPDPDALKHAQDSIQASLDNFENKLWVPSREEMLAAREAAAATPDSSAVDPGTVAPEPERSPRRPNKRGKKVREPRRTTTNNSGGGAVRSVRRTRR